MVLHISSNPIWMSLPDRMEHAAAFVMLHIELLFAPRCVLVLIYFTLLPLNSWRLEWELVGLSRLFFPLSFPCLIAGMIFGIYIMLSVYTIMLNNCVIVY